MATRRAPMDARAPASAPAGRRPRPRPAPPAPRGGPAACSASRPARPPRRPRRGTGRNARRPSPPPRRGSPPSGTGSPPVEPRVDVEAGPASRARSRARRAGRATRSDSSQARSRRAAGGAAKSAGPGSGRRAPRFSRDLHFLYPTPPSGGAPRRSSRRRARRRHLAREEVEVAPSCPGLKAPSMEANRRRADGARAEALRRIGVVPGEAAGPRGRERVLGGGVPERDLGHFFRPAWRAAGCRSGRSRSDPRDRRLVLLRSG